MQNIHNKQNPHPHQHIHQQLIIFQNNPSYNQNQNHSHQSLSSNHQINYKINHTIKKSFLNNKITNSDLYHQLNHPNTSSLPRSTPQKQKLQIFALPGSILNLSKLNPSKKNTNQSFSHRKLFPQEEDFLNQLKQKTKIKSSRNFTKSFINDTAKNIPTYLQKIQSRRTNNNNDGQFVNFGSHKGNRSKTLDVQNTNDSNTQIYTPFKKQKNFLVFKKNYERQLSENMNKFYEKFENFCKKEHKQKLGTFNDINKNNENSSDKKRYITRKPSFKQKIEQKMDKKNQKKLSNINKNKQKSKRQSNLPSNVVQIKNQNQGEKMSLDQNKIKNLAKSNINNKVFDGSNKKQTVKKTQKSSTKQSQNLDLPNSTHYKVSQNKPEQQNKFFFSYKGQRIHQSDKIPDSTSYLLKSQSNIHKKKNKYFPNQKSLKINNNMHVVITQNNKTKINIFHNSMLLKQDPQKVDALASLVREATENSKPQKISIPFQLEINKLNIVQKNSPTSVKNLQKKVNEQIRQIVKNIKKNRKSSIKKMKTQRKYNIRMQDVQPWQINDKKNITGSKQLFNSSFYCNSKVID